MSLKRLRIGVNGPAIKAGCIVEAVLASAT